MRAPTASTDSGGRREASITCRRRRKKASNGHRRGVTWKLFQEIVRVNELVPEPRISSRIEDRAYPVNDQGRSLGSPRIGMIGQPNIKGEVNANIDRHNGRIQGASIGGKRPNAGASLHGVKHGRAGVRANADNSL